MIPPLFSINAKTPPIIPTPKNNKPKVVELTAPRLVLPNIGPRHDQNTGSSFLLQRLEHKLLIVRSVTF